MKKALLIMTYGSPLEYTFESVADFYTNIRDGVRPTDNEIDDLYGKYKTIGSCPLPKITANTAKELCKRFGNEFSVYYAYKFSTPRIFETIKNMEEDGITHCLCLILEPYYSMYSVMGYERFIKSEKIQFNIISSWHKEENLVKYWAEEIKSKIDLAIGENFKVVFTAHSVPKIALEMNDPYIEQINETLYKIVEKANLMEDEYTLAWQSESHNGMEWIKPDVLEYLEENSDKKGEYIFAPIGFISDHIEILYDIDVECKKLCEKLGLGFNRINMPNNDKRLIDVLESVINRHKNSEYKIYIDEENKMEFEESDKELKMPYFVKKLIEKRGKENVKMPEYVRKMLIKAGKLKE